MRFEVNAPIAKRGIAWRLLGGALLLMVTVFVLTGGHLQLAPTLGMLALIAFAIIAGLRNAKAPSKETHAVVADIAGLTVDGELVMPHAAITRGYTALAQDGLHGVYLDGRGLRRSCTVFVPTEAEGDALLAALQLDADEKISQWRALPPWAKHVRWLTIILTASPWVLINVLRLLPIWGWGVLIALYGVILLPTLLPQRVDVGHDGVFLRWLGNKRFVPFGKIVGVSASHVGVDLVLQGGRIMEIRLTQKANGANAQRDALLARIKQGMATTRGLSRADEESLLARGSRDVDTWLREMRQLGSAEGGYRAVAIPREKLWEVLENPSSDPSAREGAALALHGSLDEDERARLRALTSKTASPRLRVALDGIGKEREETRLRIAVETAEAELEELEVNDDVARASTIRRDG